jgi:hypothetical protein
MAKKKSDEEILFSAVKIGDIEVKPFSFGVLFKVSSYLEVILDKIEKNNITVVTDTGLNIAGIVKLMSLCGEDIIKVLALTTGVEEDKVRELSVDNGVLLAKTVFEQNADIVKKSLAVLMPIKKTNSQ